MYIALSILVVLLPYLLGSIPTAVWVSRGMFGTDIRTQGSGNAGSTNMFRILGAKAGIITQIVDIAKGTLAAFLPLILASSFPEDPSFISGWEMEMQKLFCGLIAVIGHIYPVFAAFRGGKGINTLLGMMLATNPLAAGICLIFWIAVLYLTRYVAVASMAAVASYPLFLVVKAMATGAEMNPLLIGLGTGMALLVVFTHRSNIANLMAGKEHRNRWFEGKIKG